MSWARYDDEFALNRKVGRLIARGKDGVAAIGLHLLANTYCRHNGTAGHVEAHVPGLLVGAFGSKLAQILEADGMFDPDERGGWQIHDYAEFHDPNDPDPDRSAADRKRELSEKRAEAGRRGGLAKAKQTSSKATDLPEAKPWQTPSPDPDPVPGTANGCTETPPPRHGTTGGGKSSPTKKRGDVIRAYGQVAVAKAKVAGTPITSDDGYARKAERTCKGLPDLDRYITSYPDAPADAIAAWLHGDKHSMSYYPQETTA